MSTPPASITYDSEILHDIIQWDIPTWKKAIFLWDGHFSDIRGLRVLDIGARDGGLSLYFALRGASVVCSDLGGPTATARELHRKYGVESRIDYSALSATELPFEEGVFDIVAFKSVLGAVGSHDNYGAQKQAVSEMFRVLKTGGSILFAENTQGSPIHRGLRRCLTTWGSRWRYLNRSEVIDLLSGGTNLKADYAGVLTLFGRTHSQKKVLGLADQILQPVTPKEFRYMVYGYAVK